MNNARQSVIDLISIFNNECREALQIRKDIPFDRIELELLELCHTKAYKTKEGEKTSIVITLRVVCNYWIDNDLYSSLILNESLEAAPSQLLSTMVVAYIHLLKGYANMSMFGVSPYTFQDVIKGTFTLSPFNNEHKTALQYFGIDKEKS